MRERNLEQDLQKSFEILNQKSKEERDQSNTELQMEKAKIIEKITNETKKPYSFNLFDAAANGNLKSVKNLLQQNMQ